MGDRMTPLSYSVLLKWIVREYVSENSIFSIPESCFYRVDAKKKLNLFDSFCTLPLGPAAGPHTQLAQNIAAACLTGSRFFELKTVQIMDNLDIEKPCIDACDECYNTEWSTELTVNDALKEYQKAWFLVHILNTALDIDTESLSPFIFNMSVGYDLEGIKSGKIDGFINSMKYTSSDTFINLMLEETDAVLGIQGINKSVFGQRRDKILQTLEAVSGSVSSSVTLSTMHGCPPGDIETICKYLLKEKSLHTYVKLNPTLLGFEAVSDIIKNKGFSEIQLNKEAFEHDLQMKDALPMLERLREFAKQENRQFGVKLSNTLPVINSGPFLPGKEKYMSGAPLYPLTVNLASQLADYFKGDINISFSGGAASYNIGSLVSTGIRPVTVATELLKPGGYLRMIQLAEETESSWNQCSKDIIDTKLLRDIAEESKKPMPSGIQLYGKPRIHGTLPLLNCVKAPCVENCPVHQDIPDYISLLGRELPEKALETIYRKNPLPGITGTICDHQCMFNCTRNEYDLPVKIRDMKKRAFDTSYTSLIKKAVKVDTKWSESRVAVIGAGPGGLAAADILADNGIRVCVFEKKESAGGIVTHTLPGFRITPEAIDQDISRIESKGVEFRFNQKNFSIKTLKKEGFSYFVLAVGSEKSLELNMEGENDSVFSAVEFLNQFNKGEINESLIKGNGVVVGGGNTAMDSARALKKLDTVESVTLIYRRTVNEMPADREEFDNALKDGVVFKPLLQPICFDKEGVLTCSEMKIEGKGNDGRNSVTSTGHTVYVQADFVISAIGEIPDAEALNSLGLVDDARNKINGTTCETAMENVFLAGDARTGPSTVIKAVSDGRAAGLEIVKRINETSIGDYFEKSEPIDEKRIDFILRKKGVVFNSRSQNPETFSSDIEAESCLECHVICNKCVDVCPNRANLPLKIELENCSDIFQILHLDDLCNECGNCEVFCPYEEGAPFRDKLNFFSTQSAMESNLRDGFCLTADNGFQADIRLDERIYKASFDSDGELSTLSSDCRKEPPAEEVVSVVQIVGYFIKNYQGVLTGRSR